LMHASNNPVNAFVARVNNSAPPKPQVLAGPYRLTAGTRLAIPRRPGGYWRTSRYGPDGPDHQRDQSAPEEQHDAPHQEPTPAVVVGPHHFAQASFGLWAHPRPASPPGPVPEAPQRSGQNALLGYLVAALHCRHGWIQPRQDRRRRTPAPDRGHVRGIQKMIEEDLYCIDVLTQVNAARRDWGASRCSCSALTPSTV
jgi:hypothetical protein